MSIHVKRRILFAIVVTLAIWPLAHVFVVRALELNPWNWFGWAMYTQPVDRVIAEAYSPDGQALSPLLPRLADRDRARIRAAYDGWSRRYLEIPKFDDPDEFARAILEVQRGWASVRIVVIRISMDRETATITREEPREFTYSRADVGL